jgi:hypothetical protein
MKLRKRWIVLGVVAVGVAYGSYNFKEDRLFVQTTIAHSAKGDVRKTLELMEQTSFLANPLINIYYQVKKGQFQARFVDRDEQFDDISSSVAINQIANTYRQYWSAKLLGIPEATDEQLFEDLAMILERPPLADGAAPRDPDVVFGALLELIEAEGLYATSFYLNGMYGLKIWEEQSSEMHQISLPNETIDVEVVRIENYLLRGMNSYFTLNAYADGGWVATNQKVYCNVDEYDFDSEKFLVSFLKHEGQHYADLKKFPNLTGADLEYRSKLVELMYCTDAIRYALLKKFVLNASGEDRAFSHAYANRNLIQNLSQILFDEPYVEDLDSWDSISFKRVNAAAKALFEENCEQLEQDPLVSELIMTGLS